MKELSVITVRGSASDRGEQYGSQARTRIHRSREEYEKVFAHFATWDWPRVRSEAEAFIAPIERFNPLGRSGVKYLEEMRGIADGSGLEFLDVLAMNLRTEIMFAAKARVTGAALPPIAECTSFLDIAGASGSRLLGQNWDWMPFAEETVVLIEAVPDDGPSWMTVVEAGLLAKFGMNSAGLAVATNALVTSADVGAPGVPYHVMLRALLDCTTSAEVVATLETADRSSSANYMLLLDDSLAINAETRAGGADQITWSNPDPSGILLHANHFSETTPLPPGVVDVGITVMPDTLFRLQRAGMLAEQTAEAQPGDTEQNGHIEVWKRLLGDHAGYPDSLCCHPNPATDPIDQGSTVSSVIFEPAEKRAHLVFGNPCSGQWQTRDYHALFA